MNPCVYIKVLALWLFLHSVTTAFAKEENGFDFIENKGQWDQKIQYMADLPGGALLIGNQGFCYHYTSNEDMERVNTLREAGKNADSEIVHQHTYKVNFTGANTDIRYHAENKRSNYNNYFIGKDSSRWKGGVGLFGKVTMQNIYDGIDIAVYSKSSSLKYDFLVAPGANPDKIVLSFEGVMPELDAATGNLRIKTSVNEIMEQAPYAYQRIKGKEVPVPCHFQLLKGQLSFVLPEGYDARFPLVIDPVLVFATFSGAGNFASGYFSFCTTYDASGNLYAAGVPLRGFWSPDPLWPTTPGAFQPEWTTIYEPMVCINKYNATGSSLVYSTYYGGGGPDDIPHSMIVNSSEELILAGSTGSFNLPHSPDCFDSTKSGGIDMFVAHFNSSCTALIGATYIGGTIGNTINAIDINSTFGFTNQNKTSPVELALDSADNIWVVSNTSATDFPVSANALQPSFGGGNCDGVLFALNPTCSQLLYGTFLGGNNTDVAYSIQFNHAGNVVVCGGTKSENFPTISGAFHPTAPGGDWDGYVSIINPATGSLLQSSYIGTANKDQATHVQVDEFDNVYVMGPTLGNYPVSPGVYSLSNTDLFIDKLRPDLSSSLVSTRIGVPQSSVSQYFPSSFLVDNCSNVYVTGLSFKKVPFIPPDSMFMGGYPLENMPLTPDAVQTTPAPFWFCVFKPDFSDLLYATYFGRANGIEVNNNGDTIYFAGDHTHTGANHLDPHGILYHSICVGSPSYPGTTAQSWSQFNQNTVGQDILSFKFRFDLSGVESGTILTPGQNDSACVPYTVQFANNAYLAQTYTWDFGDGSPFSNDPNPSHTYTSPGVYSVSLHIHNDTTICHNDDTAFKTITVLDAHMPDITVQDTLICHYEQQINLEVLVNNPTVNNLFRWAPASGIISGIYQQNVVVNPNTDTLFTITVWDTIPGFCGYSTTDTIHIDYKPRILDILNNDTLVCQGTAIVMNVTGTQGYTYQWSPANGVTPLTAQNPLITPEQSTTYTLTASYPGCADTTQSITIRVDDPVSANFSTDPDSICTGQSIMFTPQTDSTTLELLWQLGDGNTLNTPNEILQHAYDIAGTMPVTLKARFRACPDTSATKFVYVYPLPLVNLGPDSGLCLDGAPIFLQNLQPPPVAAYHQLWNTGDTTANIKVVHPGIFSLTVRTEPLGCSTMETITIHKDCYIDIPNAFTPNGDGINDYFFPRQLLSLKVTQFRMQVFNRWGQVVFETDRIDGRGWDGKLNGKEQPQGVYVYLIDVTIDGTHPEHYQGNVTLIR